MQKDSGLFFRKKARQMKTANTRTLNTGHWVDFIPAVMEKGGVRGGGEGRGVHAARMNLYWYGRERGQSINTWGRSSIIRERSSEEGPVHHIRWTQSNRNNDWGSFSSGFSRTSGEYGGLGKWGALPEGNRFKDVCPMASTQCSVSGHYTLL